ncbi:MAG: ABC transporter ATP-binding protein [Thermoplasmata archaeon]|uniref:ABC transporter ATP-binding protein n=1 Tax=Candidatus Sysuiplasma superficiale TaxID=2823368 RepID=A0A8J7YMB7_9ARCH|nr:ABC transporter ATP-binding protein [Candidatus Sysuiplasma superficiale]MBX8643473.1 ABC transporter ATP-binding protein [Candidatus Sysuiplasma superficiale]
MPLSVRNLTIRYGERTAVEDLSFDVHPGKIYGLLGPNGAGKTSTLKAILGLVEKSSGRAFVYGKDVRDDPVYVKNRIGVVLESPVLFDSLTPNEFMEFVASIRKVDNRGRIEHLVNAFGLQEYMETPIASLSMGNRQKTTIVAALMSEPPLLLLDEPFNGLDIRSVKIFKELILNHVRRGNSVLFSTHILDVVEKICDEVGILNNGRMVEHGTMDDLRKRLEGSDLEEIFLKATKMDEEIESILRAFE